LCAVSGKSEAANMFIGTSFQKRDLGDRASR